MEPFFSYRANTGPSNPSDCANPDFINFLETEPYHASETSFAATANEVTDSFRGGGIAPPPDLLNLSVAENSLMFEELKTQIKEKFPELLQDSDFTYGSGPTGSNRLKGHLANFVNKFFPLPAEAWIKPEHIIPQSGVYGALENISWAIANPGDGILIGRPLYGGFITGLTDSRSKVKVVAVDFGLIDPFGIDAVGIYENALISSNESGTPIRAILLCNPHNPLGKCYSEAVLKGYIQLCADYGIHLISDEIYAMSRFKPHDFVSVLAIPDPTRIAPQPRSPHVPSDHTERIHVLYGMSKDFGASGVRLGAIITRSKKLREMIVVNSFLSWVSSGGDIMWSSVLCDEKFLKSFFETNQKRLANNYGVITKALNDARIPYEKNGSSGLFVWIDLSYALAHSPKMTDKAKEQELIDRLEKIGGIRLSPGRKYKSEKLGWFRLTFASVQADKLVDAVTRIVNGIGHPPQ